MYLTAGQQWTDRPTVQAEASLKVTLGEVGQLAAQAARDKGDDQSERGAEPSARSAWPALQQCRQNIFSCGGSVTSC